LATMSSKNSTIKIWSYSHSPSTHGHNLDECYSPFSQHHTTHCRKTGALTAPKQHACTNGLKHHPALLESSPTGIQWSNSKSNSCRTFFGNSYTAPTPSLHTI
jgi:hypothetical protein